MGTSFDKEKQELKTKYPDMDLSYITNSVKLWQLKHFMKQARQDAMEGKSQTKIGDSCLWDVDNIVYPALENKYHFMHVFRWNRGDSFFKRELIRIQEEYKEYNQKIPIVEYPDIPIIRII